MFVRICKNTIVSTPIIELLKKILGGIFRAEKHTGANIVTMIEGLPGRPMDIHVYTGKRQACKYTFSR